VDEQIKPIALAVTCTLGDTQKLVKNIDKQIEPIALAVTGTLGDTRKLVKNVDKQVEPIAQNLAEALADAQSALKQATKTIATVENTVSDKSKLNHNVTKTLQELTAAARAIRLAFELLQRHPESLIHGKGSKGK
jgi:paraquat-inducible protein B